MGLINKIMLFLCVEHVSFLSVHSKKEPAVSFFIVRECFLFIIPFLLNLGFNAVRWEMDTIF